jgi:hypothetical protein
VPDLCLVCCCCQMYCSQMVKQTLSFSRHKWRVAPRSSGEKEEAMRWGFRQEGTTTTLWVSSCVLGYHWWWACARAVVVLWWGGGWW